MHVVCFTCLTLLELITLVFCQGWENYKLLVMQLISVLRLLRLDLWELNYALYLHGWKANNLQSLSSFSMDTVILLFLPVLEASLRHSFQSINCLTALHSTVTTSSNIFPLKVFWRLVNRRSHRVTYSEQKGRLTHETVLIKELLHKVGQAGKCTGRLNWHFVGFSLLWYDTVHQSCLKTSSRNVDNNLNFWSTLMFWDLRFSQQCLCRLKSSGMVYHVS
jgi:hypothetical protein